MSREPHRLWLLTAITLTLRGGCAVHEVCFDDGDCPDGQVCDLARGSCGVECSIDSDCGGVGFRCDEGRCVFECAGGDLQCPDAMVSICGSFCIDVYEASRPDASATSGGADETMAVSQPDVIPWFDNDAAVMNAEVAAAACGAAGKRLCTTQQWRAVCRGLQDTDYCYGDTYDPGTCNGIDTYCDCDLYPGCYHDCGAAFHVMPTGSFPGCTNDLGVFDINGNVWELVDAGDPLDHYRGGAYNCSDSEQLHHCDYDATWNPSAKGFRCCANGTEADP